jgi:peroxiredoxin/outer membrane lipoprotein-sorting protein
MLALSSALVVLLLQTQTAPASAAAPSDRAELLGQARAALAGLTSLRFELRFSFDGQIAIGAGVGPSPTGNFALTGHVLMADGGRYRIDLFREGKLTGTVVCDGEQVTEWDARARRWTRYTLKSATGQRGYEQLVFKPQVVLTLVASWVGKDTSEAEWFTRLATVDHVRPAARREIDGRLCDSIQMEDLRDDEREESLLYFDAESHLPVRYEQTFLTAVPGVSVETGWKCAYSYTDMRVNEPLAPDAFAFTPPADATEVDAAPLRAERGRRHGKADPKERAAGEPGGEAAPEFKLGDLAGKTVALSQFKGEKVVLLTFWASWCVPCRVEMGTLSKLHDEFARQGLVVCGISTDSSKAMLEAVLKKSPVPYLILHDVDGAVAKEYEVGNLPKTLLIDKQGVVVRTWFGWSGADEEAAIRANLKQLGIGSP